MFLKFVEALEGLQLVTPITSVDALILHGIYLGLKIRPSM